MIRIDIKRKDRRIAEMRICGHAEYDVKGKDLVCAGVSCIAVGALNAIEETCNTCDLKLEEGLIHISVNLLEDRDTQIMLEMLRIQLLTMQEAYQNYIRLTDQEV